MLNINVFFKMAKLKKICLLNKFPNWKNTVVLNLMKY